jgi:hypothetical protein
VPSSLGKLCTAASPHRATACLTVFLPRAHDVDVESSPLEPSTQVYTEPCRSRHLRTHRSLEILGSHWPHLSSAVELRIQVEPPSVSSIAISHAIVRSPIPAESPLPRASVPLCQSFALELHLASSSEPPFHSQRHRGRCSSRCRYRCRALLAERERPSHWAAMR